MDKVRQSLRVACLGKVDDECSASSLLGFYIIHAFSFTSSFSGAPHQTDTDAVKPHICGLGAAIGRPDVLRMVIPAAAPDNLSIAVFWPAGS